MKKSKFTESQIVFALQQAESGVTVAEVCRKFGISEATFYSWKVGQNLKGIDVVSVMERIKALRGVVPQRIQCDNGSEFISKALDKWAYDNQVTLDFSRPGKPTDNPFIESFNGSFRDECLNVNWFLSLEDAKEKIQLFKEEYNGFRPHSSLSGLTPNEVVQQHSHGPIFSILGR